jgi:predicted GNAT family N-acyltransferase
MSWESAREQAVPLRFAVFVQEQGVPVEIELDELDAGCLHALAFQGNRAVGTGRLLPDGHVGRMAVLKPWRRRGIGGAMLKKLVEAAAGRGVRTLRLSAQVHALEFYRAHGFRPEGKVYEEAGIPHQGMLRQL